MERPGAGSTYVLVVDSGSNVKTYLANQALRSWTNDYKEAYRFRSKEHAEQFIGPSRAVAVRVIQHPDDPMHE